MKDQPQAPRVGSNPRPGLAHNGANTDRWCTKVHLDVGDLDNDEVLSRRSSGQSNNGQPDRLSAQSAEIRARTIRYHPKLNPKYERRGGRCVGSRRSKLMPDPCSSMGRSLIGHELTSVIHSSMAQAAASRVG